MPLVAFTASQPLSHDDLNGNFNVLPNADAVNAAAAAAAQVKANAALPKPLVLPAAPVTLADVIAIIRSSGLSA